MNGMEATLEITSQLTERKAVILVEFKWGERDVRIQAGQKILTDPIMHHNKPDIVVTLTNPGRV